MHLKSGQVAFGLQRLSHYEEEPLQRGGCDNAEEVAAAFRRIVQNGMKGGPIHPIDLLTVRSCGQRVVETFRKKAMEVSHKRSFSVCEALQAAIEGGFPFLVHGGGPDYIPSLPAHTMSLYIVAKEGDEAVCGLQEGDAAFRELEFQALAQVKGAAGLEPSLEAMHQVFGHEGDAILTRRAAAAGTQC